MSGTISSVAVGENGIIKTSANGLDWTVVDNDKYATLNSIAWGASKFVSVGRNIIFSADGKVWTEANFKRADNYDLQFTSITWNGSWFAAVGTNGLIASSTDGVNWTNHTIANGYGHDFTNVVSNGSKFIATLSDTLYKSDDGTIWYTNLPNTGYNNYRNLSYNGEAFIVWGGQKNITSSTTNTVFVSKDGITWAKYSNNLLVMSITTQGRKFVAIGGYLPTTQIYESEDGISWQTLDMVSNNDYHNRVILYWFNNNFIKVRYSGRIYTSSDALDWKAADINFNNPFTDVQSNGTALTLPANAIAEYNATAPAPVAYSGKVYVKVGGKCPAYTGDGAFDASWCTISSSTDGVKWTEKTTENAPCLNKVVWGNGKFIAVGDSGVILTSPEDATAWSSVNSGTNDNLMDIIWDGNRFIAAGWSIIYSEDGNHWTQDSSNASNDNISRLLWSSDQYIGIGNKSIIVAPRSIEFKDMKNNWAEQYVSKLAAKGIIKGVDQNNFAPSRDITRAEFATIIVRALGLSSSANATRFSDVDASAWYSSSISAAYDNGVLTGYGNAIIKPSNNITREEAMTMTARAMKLVAINTDISDIETNSMLNKFIDYKDVSKWARQPAANCIKNSIIQGSAGNLNPKSNITRAETAAVIVRLLQKAGRL